MGAAIDTGGSKKSFDVELNMPQGDKTARAVIRVIDVMTFDAAGKFSSMRAYWGSSDMEVLGAG